jgi:uncharacterized phiE125 gp8 family phage protein
MTLKLITPPDETITLEQAKLCLRVDNSDEDDLITALVTAAREQCEHELGRGIGTQTWQRALDAFPASGIALGMPPVTSIVSVQYVDTDGVTQTAAGDTYVLDNASDDEAWVLPADGYEWPDTLDTANAVRVQFTCGMTTIPQTVRAWMLLRIGSLYAHRTEFVAGAQVAKLPNEYASRLLDRYRVINP